MKRQRSEVSSGNNPIWWNRIANEILSAGGHIHEWLEFDESTRELKLSTNDDDTAQQNVNPDTVLFKIPVACMVTREKSLQISPWLEVLEACEKRPEKPLAEAYNDDSKKDDIPHNETFFYNDPTDLIIALAMASESPDKLLYLQSLPPASSFDALPRRWSDDKIQQLLSNTSIFERVQNAKVGARDDYVKAKRLYETPQNQSPNQLPFPSFEKFSDMLAAVTSRAFQVGDSSKDVALVPLLDLSDHSRGSMEQKKNVSYHIEHSDDNQNACMVVESAASIRRGECLRLTYGALGNAQLLMNYGFCIPQNIEPDGSSNDVLEFDVMRGRDDVKTTILLRAGPKSYSYGGFKSALDAYRPKELSSNSAEVENVFQDNFESFLDDTGDDEEDEEDEFEDLYATGDHGSDQLEPINKTSSLDDGKQALLNFQNALIKKYHLYKCKGAVLEASLENERGPEAFAAILCHSEQRTILFFLQAVQKIFSKLFPKDTCQSHRPDLQLAQNDIDLIESQTIELSKAYLAIRKGF